MWVPLLLSDIPMYFQYFVVSLQCNPVLSIHYFFALALFSI